MKLALTRWLITHIAKKNVLNWRMLFHFHNDVYFAYHWNMPPLCYSALSSGCMYRGKSLHGLWLWICNCLMRQRSPLWKESLCSRLLKIKKARNKVSKKEGSKVIGKDWYRVFAFSMIYAKNRRAGSLEELISDLKSWWGGQGHGRIFFFFVLMLVFFAVISWPRKKGFEEQLNLK